MWLVVDQRKAWEKAFRSCRLYFDIKKRTKRCSRYSYCVDCNYTTIIQLRDKNLPGKLLACLPTLARGVFNPPVRLLFLT